MCLSRGCAPQTSWSRRSTRSSRVALRRTSSGRASRLRPSRPTSIQPASRTGRSSEARGCAGEGRFPTTRRRATHRLATAWPGGCWPPVRTWPTSNRVTWWPARATSARSMRNEWQCRARSSRRSHSVWRPPTRRSSRWDPSRFTVCGGPTASLARPSSSWAWVFWVCLRCRSLARRACTWSASIPTANVAAWQPAWAPNTRSVHTTPPR